MNHLSFSAPTLKGGLKKLIKFLRYFNWALAFKMTLPYGLKPH